VPLPQPDLNVFCAHATQGPTPVVPVYPIYGADHHLSLEAVMLRVCSIKGLPGLQPQSPIESLATLKVVLLLKHV
jgi:hypothetical protein